MEINKILQGDALTELKKLPENSVDAIVTDPPYELGFMGKKWDNSGITNNVLMWKEALRVLKPGGHLLSFGGTRTYHRMTCAIEDAGFEIRDCIEWVYGSGFPKSLNIANALAKRDGAKRDGAGTQGNTFPIKNEYREYILTEKAKEWEGWGTALKPAHEPIVVARKPLSEKTVALNVLKWGTGGINIDGCRIGHNEPEKLTDRTSRTEENIFSDESCGFKKEINHIASASQQGRFPANLIHDGSEEVLAEFPQSNNQGHWTKTKTFGYENFENRCSDKEVGKSEYFGVGEKDKLGGSSARFFKTCEYTEEDYPCFFYVAKTSKSERDFGLEEFEIKQVNSALNTKNGTGERLDGQPSPMRHNFHPTVKPIKLMEYLIKLVTPKSGIVLDPFTGSGSTGCASVKLGYRFIGIEKEKDYVKIAEARLKPYLEQEKLK